ncbi:MAG TPA: hypothetical protein VLT36_22650 [Candidatus Dormibacteraeota bacterium]|nr:hypothetical protein [Candidatus Dormibacteraeota bacterium]
MSLLFLGVPCRAHAIRNGTPDTNALYGGVGQILPSSQLQRPGTGVLISRHCVLTTYEVIGNQTGLRLEPNGSSAPNVIGGAAINTAEATVQGAMIGAGYANTKKGNWSVIAGGTNNTTFPASDLSIIGGGNGNTIRPSAGASMIGGGKANTIQTNAYESTIGGGYNNTIQPGADHSTPGGGCSNTNSASDATVPEGDKNVAGTNSFAAGHRAKATYTGSFVWADSTEADFSTTGTKQFVIRAAGGVGIGVTNPAGQLHVRSANFVTLELNTSPPGTPTAWRSRRSRD